MTGTVTAIRIERAETATRQYDCITVVIGDLHLRCDLMDDRQIRLAQRLADSHGVALHVGPGLGGRVAAALEEA